MDDKTQSSQVGWERGKLLRLNKNNNQIKRNIDSTTRNRLVIGVILLISVLLLVVSLIMSKSFFTFVAIAGLIVGGFMFARATARIGGARKAMEMNEERVSNVKIRLAESIAKQTKTK